MDQNKMDLIAKLLAKAERTTPEEAEALTAAATKLMVKHGIDQAVIDARRAREGQAAEQIVERAIVLTGVYRDALVDVASSIADGLGNLRVLAARRDNRRVVYIVGFESDADQAVVLIQSLHLQAMVAMRAWWQESRGRYAAYYPHEQRASRADHLRGFGIGAAARIKENRRQVIEEAGTGTDLVLLDRGQRVDEHVDGLGLRTARQGNRRQDHHAQGRGYRAGREANTGERAMTTGRAIEA